MKCDICNQDIREGETAHGIKYGQIDEQHNLFIPARDSAWSVFCSSCGELMFWLIFAKLDSSNSNTSINHPR